MILFFALFVESFHPFKSMLNLLPCACLLRLVSSNAPEKESGVQRAGGTDQSFCACGDMYGGS
jgi:hypothetical protein